VHLAEHDIQTANTAKPKGDSAKLAGFDSTGFGLAKQGRGLKSAIAIHQPPHSVLLVEIKALAYKWEWRGMPAVDTHLVDFFDIDLR
jgi:hypothetical protein